MDLSIRKPQFRDHVLLGSLHYRPKELAAVDGDASAVWRDDWARFPRYRDRTSELPLAIPNDGG